MEKNECIHGNIYVHKYETECLDCGMSLKNVGIIVDGK